MVCFVCQEKSMKSCTLFTLLKINSLYAVVLFGLLEVDGVHLLAVCEGGSCTGISVFIKSGLKDVS